MESRMDLNLLKTFDAVIKSQSVNEAAEILHITAPAVSHALNRLREHYQDPLFVRKGRGIVPTNYALELHAEIQEPLSLLLNGANLREEFDPKTSQRTFRVSSHKDIDVMLVPHLTRYKQEHSPYITVKADIEHLNETARQEDLVRRKVDIVLATVPLTDHGYSNELLFESELVVTASKSHPRIQDTLSAEDFSRELHVVWQTERLNTLLLESLVSEMLPNRKVAYATGSTITALALAEDTDWLCVSSRWHAEKYADAFGLNVFEVPFEAKKVPVYMTWHHSQRKDKGHQWLRNAIIESVKNI